MMIVKRVGRLFAFEGLDGSGKSTQLALLAEVLENEGFKVVATREPTDGPYGRRIRQLLTNRGQCSVEEELELFMADRREHVDSLILPSLSEGEIVLTDRYYLSTAAYQGALGHDPEAIMKANEAFAPQPDLCFFLNVPVHTGLVRITVGRGERPNDFEKEGNLLQVQKVFAGLKRPFIRQINGARSVAEVHAEILSLVHGVLKVNTRGARK
jgi:dTMP kinase